MKIVTDSATDINLLPMGDVDIPVVPLRVKVGESELLDKISMTQDEFYQLLEDTGELPVTSQPSPGEFANIYRELAKNDPDILSIHMSSGLSGTHNSAVLAADMVPEANITVVDTKTLAAAAGWQVWAAVRGIELGWPKERIVAKLKEIGDATSSIFTLKELKYLIHGGGISHIKGLIASMLNIKSIIGVSRELGNYFQLGQEFTFSKALKHLANTVIDHAEGEKLRVQVVHTGNEAVARKLQGMIEDAGSCIWMPLGRMSYVLGAHTGTTMVGVGYCKESVFADLMSGK